MSKHALHGQDEKLTSLRFMLRFDACIILYHLYVKITEFIFVDQCLCPVHLCILDLDLVLVLFFYS